MRGGFPSTSTMRPGPCRTVLQVTVLAVLLLVLGADSQDLSCQEALKVRRGTVRNVSLGKELQLSCPFVFCNGTPPEISWLKLEEDIPISISSTSTTKTLTKEGNPEGISYLIFQRIHRNDSGLYQCKLGADVSHYINVSVIDSTPSPDADFMAELWPYVYPAAGIVAFVIIVIIVSVVVMRGCRGKSKKEKENENQYMAIPMFEHSTPASIPPPTRGSPISQHALPSRGAERIYDNAPCQRPAQTSAPSLGANQPAASGHTEHVYSMSKRKREKKKKAEEEEENPVVYAALNHQPAAHPPPRRPREEYSEYAAIRVP
ncbi:uncharacterized protein LOC115373150 isoform X2 [Myripristis murdjan]|uniref:uncharacterized protein LOC115373150 isoform X2 n=1 Tax=Myripristis murdjan TaxID=586833 RepID=UPI0011761DC3|nr:uncharacterized protein LOC115373150 isoform X2 [Myripristis murdjan]